MIRNGLNKFSMAMKPIALKPLPQFETPESSPSWNSDLKNTNTTEYSSTYGRQDDDRPLISSKPSINTIRDSSDRLPPKEFRAPDRSRRQQLPVQIALFVFICLTISIPLYITQKVVYPRTLKVGNLPFFDCTYPGHFSFKGINVPFGKMPWSIAKSADLAFNAIIGRGVQFLLAWICYRLFNVILMHITETHRISYQLYATLALTPVQISSLQQTTKSLFSKLPGFVKFQIFWLIVTTVYLALFPTLIDSISGYQAIQDTMFKLPNGTMLNTPLQNYLPPVDYGSTLMNEAFDRIISTSAPPNNEKFTFYYSTVGFTGFHMERDEIVYSIPTYYAVDKNSSSNPFNITTTPYASINSSGVYTSACINTTTSFVFELLNSSAVIESAQSPIVDTDIFGPPSWSYTDPSCINWFHLQNGFSMNLNIRFNTSQSDKDVWFAYTPVWNVSYFYDSNNYECVSSSKLKYQWGISYEFLLMGASINSVWVLVTYVIFMHASRSSQITNKGRKFGMWRAIMDLAGALHEDLGTEHSAYGEDELDKEVTRLSKAGRGLKYHVMGGDNYDDGERGNWKDNPRLALSTSGSDIRVRLNHGTVYG